MTTSSHPKPLNPLLIYAAAALLLWPVVTLAIYYAARFDAAYLSLGALTPTIGLRSAGLWALLMSLAILVTGWLQSERRTKS